MAYRRGYASELYPLTDVHKFSTEIFEVPDDDHIGRRM
jgi:hypothetical protein